MTFLLVCNNIHFEIGQCKEINRSCGRNAECCTKHCRVNLVKSHESYESYESYKTNESGVCYKRGKCNNLQEYCKNDSDCCSYHCINNSCKRYAGTNLKETW